MKNKQITLTVKTFIYFVIFAVVIVIGFWLIETYFLGKVYAKTTKENCYEVAVSINGFISNYDENTLNIDADYVKGVLKDIASENEMSIWLIEKGNTGLYTIKYGDKINPVQISNIWNTIKKSNLSENFSENDSRFTFSKILTLKDGKEVLLILITRLVPVKYISIMLRNQIINITVMIILLTTVFAIIVARNLSKPISSLNNAAKVLAEGKYDTKFEAAGYLEIKELSDTLNYAVSELAKLDSYQKELIANVSHDLRTPLTLITGYSEMMRDYPSEITKDNLQIIIDEANRLTTLVNAILDLSKLQSKTDNIEREELNVTDLIEQIIKRNNHFLTPIDCSVKFEFDEEAYVYADQRRLETIIYNFLSNSIHYCGEDKLVIVRQTIEDNFVKITFVDHGIGIPKEHIKDIWNRYYKINKNHNRKKEGTGLGLYIIKTALDQYGAEYGVESEEGKGSEFWFKLEKIEKNTGGLNEK